MFPLHGPHGVQGVGPMVEVFFDAKACNPRSRAVQRITAGRCLGYLKVVSVMRNLNALILSYACGILLITEVIMTRGLSNME